MASYNTPIITTQGQSLLKATIANNDTMTFTKIVFSSDDYSQSTDSNVASLTALSSLDLTATARAFVDVNGNLKIRGVANNQNTTSAFYIKTYGLYVKNSAGTEMLFAVATTQNANFVPAYNNKQTNQVAYTFNLAISSTSNITLSNQSDVDVTQADIASINSAVNSNASSLSSSMSNVSNSLSSSITNNSSAINSLSNTVGNQSANISYLNSFANTASQNQLQNSSAISSNSNNIANNSSAINSLVSSASSAIGSNATNIDTLQSIVSTNSNAISSNASLASQAISNVNSDINKANDDIKDTKQNLDGLLNRFNNSALEYKGTIKDFNDVETGIYNFNGNYPKNFITDWYLPWGEAIIEEHEYSGIQLAIVPGKHKIYFRVKSNGNWADWMNTVSSDELNTAINQINSNIQSLQNNYSSLNSNTLQYRGVWQGDYSNWSNHPDGIYSIDQNQNPLNNFMTNGQISAFSGWGQLTLTTNTTNQDRYCVLHDNVNQMFRNHLFVGSDTFSGWIKY